jgi:hypothetical protein
VGQGDFQTIGFPSAEAASDICCRYDKKVAQNQQIVSRWKNQGSCAKIPLTEIRQIRAEVAQLYLGEEELKQSQLQIAEQQL